MNYDESTLFDEREPSTAASEGPDFVTVLYDAEIVFTGGSLSVVLKRIHRPSDPISMVGVEGPVECSGFV